MGHGRTICKECNKVIITCKCMKCSDNITYDICNDCRKIEKKGEIIGKLTKDTLIEGKVYSKGTEFEIIDATKTKESKLKEGAMLVGIETVSILSQFLDNTYDKVSPLAIVKKMDKNIPQGYDFIRKYLVKQNILALKGVEPTDLEVKEFFSSRPSFTKWAGDEIGLIWRALVSYSYQIDSSNKTMPLYKGLMELRKVMPYHLIEYLSETKYGDFWAD